MTPAFDAEYAPGPAPELIPATLAVAAKHARAAHPSIRRIAIYDMDVHHGNGTQDAFDDDASVLFISSHQEKIFPDTGHVDRTGSAGTSINVPLPALAGHESALAVLDRIVEPAIRRFRPDLILVSAVRAGRARAAPRR